MMNHEIRFEWTWILESLLHPGSGLSRPGVADSLVQRDADGKPALSGDAIRGALRMSAEHPAFTSFSDCGNTIDSCLLFMYEDSSIIGSGKISLKHNPVIVAQTSIDSSRGVAKKDSLRTTEFIPAGAEIKCYSIIRAAPEDVSRYTLSFLGVLAGVGHIGAGKSSGNGKVGLKPDSLQIRMNGTAINVAELLDFKNPASSSAIPVMRVLNRQNSGTASWYRCTIELEETTCIGSEPDTSNMTSTKEFIPATTLRGAFIAAWKRMGLFLPEIESMIGPASRWLPAYPKDDSVADGNIFIPVPASYIAPKNGGRVADNVHDVLTGTQPDGSVQWRKFSAKWMSPSAQAIKKIEKISTMHVALNYQTGSKVEGALFSRQHIAPHSNNSTYISWIRCPEVPPAPASLSLGKRKSAGHGLATVKLEKCDVPPFIAAPDDSRTEVFIQLLSPMIIRGEDGLPLTGLNTEGWNRIFEKDYVKSCVSRTSSTRIASWISTWGHMRAPVTAIDAGSVWKLVKNDAVSAQDFMTALSRLEQEGLGERRHEGYGWLCINPAWLGSKSVEHLEPANQAGGRERTTESRPRAGKWPGIDLAPEHARELLHRFQNLLNGATKSEAGYRSQLRELATFARANTTSMESIRNYVNARCSSRNSSWLGEWRRDKPSAAIFTECNTLEEVRFILEILLIQAGKERA